MNSFTKHRNPFLTTLTFLMVSAAMESMAQTDITSKYLQNPSFEADVKSGTATDAKRGAYSVTSLTGWTLSGTYGVSDIMTSSATATDNDLGKPGTPSDGTQMYYIRNAWADGTASLKQTVTLPKGKYRFTVDSKSATPGTSSSGRIIAGTENTTISLASKSIPATWSATSVEFTLTAETSVPLGFEFTWVNSAGASFLLDNVRLYDISGEVVKPDPTEDSVKSYTEGIINSTFVPEATMKKDLLNMLAKFSTYMVNDWNQCSATNSINESCGYFKGENSGGNNEQGVRPNADLSMICAFLVKYGKPLNVTLPTGVTWDKLEEMALKSLIFAYSTHKANKLKVCSGNGYWGSTSTSDYVWESSLWAMSVAYSAFFQWDKLSDTQKNYIYAMLKAECNYELGRTIPTGYAGDTKAEENGWEADILAATLGLFPNDALAQKWFDRLREFAINSYSHTKDAENTTVIDPDYDNKTVADLYKGQNLYDDYTLQNHNLFHTSYQNVVMQELGEAALALKMFQLGTTGTEKWKTNALMHNNQEVQDSVLNWLALPDGELAMPNGNDWSLFLYDQITSYTTQACFQKDSVALMLENMAYKYIKARQQTTGDGSWLLRADVGARRMGVEAHRVMMTYLMHDVLSTADVTPVTWDEFNKKHSEAKMLPCQNIVRASTDSRFSCFSWSDGLKSYTGYFAGNTPDKNKIVVPYRANNTGNITGWYEVSSKSTDATPVVKGIYQLDGAGYIMNGEMNVNGSALNNRFAVYSTPQNAYIYLDYVTANAACTITSEKGGLLAISTDELMKVARTLYYMGTDSIEHKQTDGSAFSQYSSKWMNIDNEVGIVSPNEGKKFAFGDRGANNSIYTSKLYPMYSGSRRSVNANAVVDARDLVYYNNISAADTKAMAEYVTPLRAKLPEGWNGIIAPDADKAYILVSNFKGTANTATVNGIRYMGWAPVFKEETTITDTTSTVTFTANQNNSVGEAVTAMIKGSNVKARQQTATSLYITASAATKIEVSICIEGSKKSAKKEISLRNGDTVLAYLKNGEVCVDSAAIPIVKTKDYTGYIINPKFEGSTSYGWTGTPTINYNCAEKFNTTFNVYQTVKGLPEGYYLLGVQGFYRDGGYDDAAKLRAAGTEKLNAQLYANDSICPIQSIFQNAGKQGAVGVRQSTYGYIPNTMEQAEVYFMHGLYTNALKCFVGTDGTLKLGVKKTATVTNDWCIFTNFTLSYLGKKGDANSDLTIDKKDVTTVIDAICGGEVTQMSDVNGDHKVDVLDANEVLNIICK